MSNNGDMDRCPFCNQEVILSGSYSKGFFIYCLTPGCWLNANHVSPRNMNTNKEVLITRWNRRTRK